MARKTKAQWRELIVQQQASGLSAAEFCRRKAINAKYFSLRKQQLGDIGKSFVQLAPSTASPIVPLAQPIKLRVIELDLPPAAVVESLALLLNASR